jgi:two-component system copper resistance phosphate regulon response regulator CusR
MKLLVVEDEEKCASFLSGGLSENGFDVDIARDGNEGLRLARNGDYDLIILDVMLPERDGWLVLEELRRDQRPLPVLVLSAVGATADRIRGLELGADDYLPKPFDFAELLARVRSVLRRGASIRSDVLVVGDLALDVARQRCNRAGKKLELTPKEYQLLALLMRRTGEVVTRRTISEQVWEMYFDPGTNVVDVHIRRLRVKVDDAFPTKLIHTVRGMGYVLEARQ